MFIFIVIVYINQSLKSTRFVKLSPQALKRTSDRRMFFDCLEPLTNVQIPSFDTMRLILRHINSSLRMSATTFVQNQGF